MATTARHYLLNIGGSGVDPSSDDELDVGNPAPENTIGRVPQASVADVDRAVTGARRAFEEGPWPRLSPRQRSDALLRLVQVVADRRGELVDLIIEETGAARPIAEALQFETGFRYAQWFAERSASFAYLGHLPPPAGSRGLGAGGIVREPVGGVA